MEMSNNAQKCHNRENSDLPPDLDLHTNVIIPWPMQHPSTKFHDNSSCTLNLIF